MPVSTLEKKRIADITKFFVSYNELQGKKFEPLGFGAAPQALELIEEAHERKCKKRA